jgi:hypothetical protein
MLFSIFNLAFIITTIIIIVKEQGYQTDSLFRKNSSCFNLVTISLMGLSGWLVSIGIYYSIVDVVHFVGLMK